MNNRLTKILILVAVFLAVFYSVIAAWGLVTPGQSALGAAATPFRWIFSFVGNTVDDLGDYFGEFDNLKEENEELARRVAELEARQAHLEDLEGENAWMREFLGVSEELAEYDADTDKLPVLPIKALRRKLRWHKVGYDGSN